MEGTTLTEETLQIGGKLPTAQKQFMQIGKNTGSTRITDEYRCTGYGTQKIKGLA